MRTRCVVPIMICLLGLAACAAAPPKSLEDGKYVIAAPKARAINQATSFCARNVQYPLLDKEAANEITFICVYADDPRYAAQVSARDKAAAGGASH